MSYRPSTITPPAKRIRIFTGQWHPRALHQIAILANGFANVAEMAQNLCSGLLRPSPLRVIILFVTRLVELSLLHANHCSDHRYRRQLRQRIA